MKKTEYFIRIDRLCYDKQHGFMIFEGKYSTEQKLYLPEIAQLDV